MRRNHTDSNGKISSRRLPEPTETPAFRTALGAVCGFAFCLSLLRFLAMFLLPPSYLWKRFFRLVGFGFLLAALCIVLAALL